MMMSSLASTWRSCARPTILAATLFAPSIALAQIEVGGGRIDVVFESKDAGVPRTMLLAWIKTAASAVTKYYGRYPVPHAIVRVESIEGDRIGSGKTFGSLDGGVIRIAVGRTTTQEHLDADWMMTHEMVHLAFPSVPDQHHWIEEGIATYVEPIARVRIGRLHEEQVWGDLVRDLPQGLPEPGDRGLDFTHTWGRTYWGGALFCLLADIEIHRRTANGKGLDDALRGILDAGASIAVDWDLERAFKAGDRATGVPVLQELYAQMCSAPSPIDLENLWRELGIERNGRTIALKSHAPLAAVRRAIMSGKLNPVARVKRSDFRLGIFMSGHASNRD